MVLIRLKNESQGHALHTHVYVLFTIYAAVLCRTHKLEVKAKGCTCVSNTIWVRILWSSILVIGMDVKCLYSSKILEIGMIFVEKIERKVHVNQQNFVSDIQLLMKLRIINDITSYTWEHKLYLARCITIFEVPLWFFIYENLTEQLSFFFAL